MSSSQPEESDHTEDAVRIRRIAAGDLGAFDALVLEYYQPLMAFAWRLVGSREAAEDALQEVFLRVWRNRETMPSELAIRPYLFTAVRHAVRDQWRSGMRESAAFANYTRTMLDESEPNVPGDALERVSAGELAIAIEQAVAALPPRSREAWLLVREQGMTHAEAAQIMGVSVNTVRVQMTRALAALRNVAQKYVRSLFFILQLPMIA